MTSLSRLISESDLHECERRFTALAGQLPIGIFETDAQGTCLYVNYRWCETIGAVAETILGKKWLLFVHPDDRDRVATEWNGAVREGRESAAEYRVNATSGQIRWVQGSIQAKLDDAGEVVGYLGTVQDITQQKKDRDESKRLNAELEQRVNEASAQLTRLAAENDRKLLEISSLYRMSNTMLSTIRLNKLVHLILAALTTGDNPFFDRALLFLINERSATMQGMLGVTRETCAGIINPNVEIEDILASRWDISEEDMLRQQASDFSCRVRASRLKLHNSRSVVSRAVLEKKLIHVADTAREKHIDREFVRRFEIKSCALAPLMAKEQVVGVIIVDNALREAPIAEDDLRFLQLVTNQAGMAIENSMLYNRIEDANRSLREARERLVQGERLSTIGEMAASIAHEVKGPLVSIGGFARRLEKTLLPASSEHSHAVTIVREVLRLEKLLTNILSFARKTTICYSTCNVSDIIEESVAVLAQAFDEHSIRIHTKYPAKGILLLADSQQLKQVFLNLLANAHEAMKAGGEARIVIGHARLNSKPAVSVKISDTGGGIPDDALHNIFNSFFTTKEAGTGLGLSIANRIVLNHGGRIQLTNKKGIGAEFNVVLPLNP